MSRCVTIGAGLDPAIGHRESIDRRTRLTESKPSSEANPGRLTIDVGVLDDTTTLTIRGEIDLDTVDMFTERARRGSIVSLGRR